ncbi:MAG TPA: hypothetical protein VGX70_03670 [Gemmataceae bacterium]|jgi:photosystem II stability/assembly factor-like uncharacterized protein|nr:hypothetical protein [Gemmataceae bacterium]
MLRVALTMTVLALFLQPVEAQTADEIIAKYAETIGGMPELQAVKTLRRTGKLQAGGGFEMVVLYENKRPNLVRQNMTMQGMTGVAAYDGQSGWKIDPWAGRKDPEPLGEDEMKAVLEDADFDGPLVNYQKKGNKVEYVGMEPVEGTDAFKLKVTLRSGDVRYFYMDTDYYVPIKMESKRMVRGAELEFETTLGDYKQVAGIYLPHSAEINTKGSSEKQKLTFEKIEANVPIDDSRFVAPGSPPRKAQAGALPSDDTDKTKPKQPKEKKSPAPSRPQTGPVKVDSETISGLGARNIGSAAMSGRVTGLDAVQEGKRLTIFVGAASGGVWKSVNGGTTYKPVFDKQPVQSIGAITIDPKNPKTIWVGTGEPWTRNSTSIGDGVYKSTDGGENWTNMGLKESERIAKIIVDPSDSNIVYISVPGKLWSDSDERGLYKTIDGGKTWAKILKGSNLSTGCSTMAMDSKDPKTIYAGMWDFRRQGWTFRSGGDGPNAPSGSGLFKSTDAGATWNELDEKSAKGLPAKPWGRVALAVAPSKPSIVYAFIEATPPKNGLYRSEDGGKTWTALDRSQNMVWRPFYFANLIVDPKDENKVYKAGGSLIMSTDGGRSFSNISGGAHGDFHDVWINPSNTDHVITGDDGGIWYSYDNGNRWWKAENLPISQFYHVSVDMDMPYHVYGGLQDNSSWVGASQYPGGITNHQWENMYGGDGFWMFADPADPDYLYAELQGGEIGRVNRKTHETRNIKPLPQYKEGKLRYNWNTPIHLSGTQKGTIYIGAQFLFRSRDHGQTWERISPDLTTNDPEKQKQEESGGVTIDNSAAEMHTTIYSISESPKNSNVIWVGTDDGNVQVTRDGGKTWTNVVANIHGLPKNPWVSSIDSSHFDEGTAYITFDVHRYGDMRAYVYRTADYGKTWTSLTVDGGSVRGYAHVIKEDLVNRDLLFLGTEFGLWVSLDGGRQWAQYKGGELPSVPVMDLAIHPRDHDLVIGTHGRGIWIVDDITPLRALTPDTLSQDVVFIETKPSVQRISGPGGWVNGDAVFVGPNAPDEASITYYQKRRHIFGDLKMEVLDSEGKVQSTVPTSKRRGLSRATWSMRLKPPQVPSAAIAAGGAFMGPRILPGGYTIKMTKDQQVHNSKLQLSADPRAKHSADDRRAQFDLSMKLYNLLGDMTYAVERINAVRLGLEERISKLPSEDPLAKRLRTAGAEIDGFRKKIVATKEGGMITGEERLREFLAELYGNVVGYEGRPSQTQVERTQTIERELADVVKDFETWIAKELPGVNSAITQKQLAPVTPPTREDWEKRSGRK